MNLCYGDERMAGNYADVIEMKILSHQHRPCQLKGDNQWVSKMVIFGIVRTESSNERGTVTKFS